MSQITSHVLDTSKGTPAEGIPVILFQWDNNDWKELSREKTNKEGRITDLLMPGVVLQTGMYKMTFQTRTYFDLLSIKSFYPFIDIIFEISSLEHYHIPVLLSPYGYSTYRGS